MKDTDIKIEMRDAVSLASQQNGYPLLRRIKVKNRSEETARDVRVTLSFDPPFASAGEVVIGDIPSGKSGSADNIPDSISTEFLQPHGTGLRYGHRLGAPRRGGGEPGGN